MQAFLRALVPIAVLAATTLAQGAVSARTQIVDGVPIETRKLQGAPIKGTYLITLNNVRNAQEKKPPYQALVMAVDTNGKVRVYRSFRSQENLIQVTDFKPQPDGVYSFALNRPRGQMWIYDARMLDPRDGTEIIEPSSYPIRDNALDGHETVVYHGDQRLFLYYRLRNEGGKGYWDMEVAAISVKSGERVGFWASKGLFPATESDDYLHFNSLFPLNDDQVLASARSTSTLYVLNLKTGKIDDRIDSKSWKVVGDPLGGFSRQHTAHFLPNGNLMMFDNRDKAEASPRSRAVEYKVDWKERTLTLAWQRPVEDSMPFRLGWGSAFPVGNDEVLVSWGDYPREKGFCDNRPGSFPVFSHVRRSGELLFELRAPCGWHTYRAYFVPGSTL
jgi:hypothetical protein